MNALGLGESKEALCRGEKSSTLKLLVFFLFEFLLDETEGQISQRQDESALFYFNTSKYMHAYILRLATYIQTSQVCYDGAPSYNI